MDIKLILSLIATGIGVLSFISYLKEIFRGETRPHIYTWIIWFITQGTATAGLLFGGGGIGSLDLLVGTAFIFMVVMISISRGTKNITASDKLVLVAALAAVAVWWLLKAPLASVIMVSAIDVGGYLPSVRKTYQEPWSENIISWWGFAASNIFAIAALESYNALTLTYLIAITAANVALALLCLARRPQVARAAEAAA